MFRRALLVGALLVAGSTVSNSAPVGRAASMVARCGPDRLVPDRPEPKRWIRAYFWRRSYRPGEVARLVLLAAPHGTIVQIFHADTELEPSRRADAMTGVPVTPRRPVDGEVVKVRVGRWESGLYYARLQARTWLGYAPLIVRGTAGFGNRVAVVLPTNTWEAYNFFDQARSGYGDTWYANPRVDSVRFHRPFLDRGVPPHLGRFPFWLWLNRRSADYLADDDLETFASGAQLARRYNLIIFAGHEEYVTGHAFRLITEFRNLGGNLAFLSANNFYSRVVRGRDSITCVGHFRDEGRPEAALVGVQYLDWNHGVFRSEPYVVVGAARAPWFFRGTRLRDGSRFGFSYGVEVDTLAPSSPRGIRVLAELPNIFGFGRTADMTYYVGPRGSQVFAAGAMNFESPQSPAASRLLLNLWDHLSR